MNYTFARLCWPKCGLASNCLRLALSSAGCETRSTKLNIHFRDRVLPFDATSASIYGRIIAARKRSGRPMGVLDGMIAAIALQHGASVATRDTRDFALPDLTVVDPFGFGK
jgi:predicted nucleic acid-binding protein